MTVSDLDRKRLWGRSSSRCSLCNRELTKTEGIDSIIGDEAHIRARKPGGPRYESGYPKDSLDSYENLILLCKVHHKLVDDNAPVFSVAALVEMKKRHERRVKARMEPPAGNGWVEPPELRELPNGTVLARIMSAAMAYEMVHDHPESEELAEMIGGFLQEATDWGDIADDIGPSGLAQAGMSLDRQMQDLRRLGYRVFGGVGPYRFAGMEVTSCRVVVVSEANIAEVAGVTS